MKTTPNGTLWYFGDSTELELLEISALLPSLHRDRLDSLLEWTKGKDGYFRGDYSTGTRWLIELMKWEIKNYERTNR